MAGISSWGAYAAPHRIAQATPARRTAADGPERSVAWPDEDSLTLAVEAARRCLGQRDCAKIGLVVLATTTPPFDEKQGAVLLAAALGLRADVRAVDIGGTLRCGGQALQLAHDTVSAGSVAEALVVIADCREGAPGSELERSGGDGAVAFTVAGEGCVAELVGRAGVCEEIVDTWRRRGDRFVHSWEDRFVSQYGIAGPAVSAGGMLPPAQGERVWATSAPNQRIAATIAKGVGGSLAPATAPLLQSVGFCGAAHAPLVLAATLDTATAGQEIAFLAHGDGAEALLFKVVAQGASDSVARAIAGRIPVRSQAEWRKARNLDITEYPAADDQGISATIHFRERAENIRLEGQRCTCGEPQFPKGRVCIRCGTKDSFAAETYADRGGSLVTYTLDAFFPSPTPPTAVGIVQVDDGPRIYLQITDLDGREPEIGMRLRFVFRKIHEVGKRPNYFWKAVPERIEA